MLSQLWGHGYQSKNQRFAKGTEKRSRSQRLPAAWLEELEKRALLSLTVADLSTISGGATALAQSLVGSGVSISNVTYTGDNSAGGSFSGGISEGLGLSGGVILSSGRISDAPGPNSSDGTSTNLGQSGDASLNVLVSPDSTHDAAVLEFDFIPTNSSLSFQYVFASEEYNEYVNSYNDVFGFFLDGTNIATIPGTATPVTINNVNNNVNSSYYRNNDYGDTMVNGSTPFPTEFDGFTAVLQATATVTAGITHHIKLAIADTRDSALDSAVFLAGGGFTSASSDVSVVKSDTPDPVSPSGTITYTMTVSNSGPDAAAGVILSDPLPTGTTFVSANSSVGSVSNIGGVVTASLGSLAAGATATVTLLVTAPSSPGSVTNTATVSSNSLDNNLANNTASQTTTVAVATGGISGIKWDDLNGNAVRDGGLVVGTTPDAVFVIDVSGSTSSTFQGTAVGDINGDGSSNTVLDAELAAFIALNQQMIDSGNAANSRVSIVVFGSSAVQVDMDPVTTGTQLFTRPNTDMDGNSVNDVTQILRSITGGAFGAGSSTNYIDALTKTKSTIDTLATPAGQGNMIFLSDGDPDSSAIDAQVAALATTGMNLRAFGVGNGAHLPVLQKIDANAQIFTSTDGLLAIFGGTGGGGGSGGGSSAEPGLAGVTIYIDSNGNGQLDSGEPTTVTLADDPATTGVDETGQYSFSGLSAGTYVVREVVPTGYTQTFPVNGSHSVVVSTTVVTGNDFGNAILATGGISGIKWNDLNGNAQRDGGLVVGTTPDAVFVIDVSGSTSSTFQGSAVGDINGDGSSNTVLDAELAAFIALNQQMIDSGNAANSRVSIVVFGSSAVQVDMDPVTAGTQLFTRPNTDIDGNSVNDVTQILRSIKGGAFGAGSSTNYIDALTKTKSTIDTLATPAGQGNMIFLSDGDPDSAAIDAQVAALATTGMNLRAFGVGNGAHLPVLQKIDANAQIFTSTDQLLAIFGGTGGGGGGSGGSSSSEPGLAGVTIYIDSNNNGQLDSGEPTTITLADDPATTGVDETGQYSFTGLTAGTYVVREVVPTGFTQTFPVGGSHSVVVSTTVVTSKDFGNTPLNTGGITGVKFDDLNANGTRDGGLVVGTTPDAVFVIDVSGSTSSTFQGTAVGNINGDGVSNSVLDAELAGFIALNQELINKGNAANSRVSIVVFGSSAVQVDMDPATPGLQYFTRPNTDADANGVNDVTQILRSITGGAFGAGGSTNYIDALTKTKSTIDILGTAAGQGNMIFLSDGDPDSAAIDTQVAALKTTNMNLRAFGVGKGAHLPVLQKIDPTAQIFTSTDELLNIFGGSGGGGVGGGGSAAEPGLAGVTIYIDSNNNGQLDSGEPTTVTLADDPATTGVDETGQYSFTGLAAGTYVVREVEPAGYSQTFPLNGEGHTVVVTSQVVTGKDFGNSLVTLGSISGIKFNDLNRDGVHDTGEEGLEFWQIFLDTNNNGQLDLGETYTVTDATGAYSFDNLEAGNYTVAEVVQPGWYQSLPGTSLAPASYQVTVQAGQAISGKEFGNYEVQQLSTENLKAVSLSVGPYSEYVPGDKVTYKLKVESDGTDTADGVVDIKFYASTDDIYSPGTDTLLGKLSNQKIKLASGMTKDFTLANVAVPANAVPSQLHIFGVIEVVSGITEDDADNVAVKEENIVWKFGNFAGRKGVVLNVRDPDGTKVTFTMRGSGYGQVNGPDFALLEFFNTDDTSNATVTTGTGTLLGGTVAGTAIRNINSSGNLGGLTASTMDLLGNIVMNKRLGSIILRDATVANQTFTIGDDSTSKIKGASIVFDRVRDLNITSVKNLVSVTTTEWLDTGARDVISAPSLGKLEIKGDKKRNLAGDFGADIITTDAAVTMTSLTVNGMMNGSQVHLAGSLTTGKLGGMLNSVLMAGISSSVNTLPLAANITNANATIGTLTVTALADVGDGHHSMGNFVVAAPKLGTLTLKRVRRDNGGTPDGFAYHTIKALSTVQFDKSKWTWNATTHQWVVVPAAASAPLLDLNVQVI